jgi:hypothetical protein
MLMHRRVAAAVGFLAGHGFLPSIFFCIAASAWAQSDQAPQHVVLPPAIGGTPLSQQIHAEAAYVAAYGDMVESVAMARRINAQAVALEIQNSVAYVDAYFKRREINRDRRAKEDPNYMEREKRHQEALRRRVDEQYQDVLRGDVTNMLNWLLRELADPVVAYRYLPPNATSLHSTLDRKLDPRDLEQIRLSDGGNKASRLVFAAADGKPLQPHWPLAMRGPEFSAAEESYERTLAEVVAEIGKTGQASSENQGKVIQALNALFVALDDAYPKERRRNPNEFLAYATAKRFLQSSLAATNRALATHDSNVLGGGLRFSGDSMLGLLQHMYQNGLEFAPPEPGGEGIYKALFQNLRLLYTTVGPNRPAADVQPADEDAFGDKNKKRGPAGR